MFTYENLTAKERVLSQRRCPICSSPDNNIVEFTINASPASFRNQSSSLKKCFMKEIKERIGSEHIKRWENLRICLKLTFVVPNGRSEKDIDNMSKIIMDAFHDVIYKNDRTVDHLDALKLRHDSEEEYINFGITESKINDNDDAEVKEFKHGWAGQNRVNLKECIKEEEKKRNAKLKTLPNT
jgi:Holliday junction resolvase RusA-like endonuclease